MSKWLPILVLTGLTACATPAPVVELDDDGNKPRTHLDPDEVVGEPVAIPPQFESGCTALDETEEIRGKVKMLPFGKGREGVVIDDGHIKWVVSYDSRGVFQDFEDEDVLARGTRCEKQGEAIKAYHFEARSLRVIQ